MKRIWIARGAAGALAGLAGCFVVAIGEPARAGAPRIHEDVGFELFESPQANPLVLSPDGQHLYVADTVANRVEVLDTQLRLPVSSI
jgi:hypothetical protein